MLKPDPESSALYVVEFDGKEWFTGLAFEDAKEAAIFILANDGLAPA